MPFQLHEVMLLAYAAVYGNFYGESLCDVGQVFSSNCGLRSRGRLIQDFTEFETTVGSKGLNHFRLRCECEMALYKCFY
jgi:hypothetical protein